MELWSEIRRKVLVEGVSKRAICRAYGVGWRTLEKMLAHPEPPGYRRGLPRGRPRLGAFVGVIDEILAGDADPSTPRKQRHTARRIFERLRDEHGYLGGEVAVRRYVASQRRVSGEVFVPLSQPAGEAQFDFGEATAEIAGVRVKAALAVMTLPYSDAFLVSAYPRECTETFQAGHVAAFAFFGGVPTKTAYDNTRIAVSRIVGGNERTLTREFLRLESHFLFTHRFCRVARGNEKGHVENLVGYSRRNFLVPVPSFGSFTELNAHLQERCLADLQRRLRGNGQTKAELLEADRAARLPEPAAPLLDPRQPLLPLDARNPRLGGRQQRRTRPHPDLRQLPQPDRKPLRRDRRVRLQKRRLPRLGQLRARDGQTHPPPQHPPRASATPTRRRQTTPAPNRPPNTQTRRLNDQHVSGATL